MLCLELNRFLPPPSYAVCTIDASVHHTGFLSLLGVVFLGVTTTILMAVPEEPDQNPADESSVLVTYQNVICVSCLPAVRTLLVCLLTLKVLYDSLSLSLFLLTNNYRPIVSTALFALY